MSLPWLISLIAVCGIIVVLNLRMMRKRRGTMDIARQKREDFLTTDQMEARYREAHEEYAQLHEWAKMGVIRWVWTLHPSYFDRPFEKERFDIEASNVPPLDQSDDEDGMYDSGYLYGFGRNEKLLTVRRFQRDGSYDEVFQVWEHDQRFTFEYTGPHHGLTSFSRTVFQEEQPQFWELRDKSGFHRENYIYDVRHTNLPSRIWDEHALFHQQGLLPWTEGHEWAFLYDAGGQLIEFFKSK